MREDDARHAADRFRLVGCERGISCEEGIDQHHVLAEYKTEGRMTVPSDLHRGVLTHEDDAGEDSGSPRGCNDASEADRSAGLRVHFSPTKLSWAHQLVP